MNDYASLRKQNKSPFFAVVALALCVAITSAMLFSRLAEHVAGRTEQRIPLTVSNGVTHVRTLQRQMDAGPRVVRMAATSTDGPVAPSETNPGFEIYDDDTIWEGQTDVEIFSVSYENGEGRVTVKSDRGDNVLAPGTQQEYTFTLHNTGDVGLDYILSLEAYFSDGEKTIPVQARLLDYEGKYLLGSEEKYVDVLELNKVQEENSISAGYIAPYTLQWQWPFEGDDAYDTWLGDLAANEDISLTIVIRTVAVLGGEGGLPETGDRGMIITAVAMVASLAGLLTVVLLPKRKQEEYHGV